MSNPEAIPRPKSGSGNLLSDASRDSGWMTGNPEIIQQRSSEKGANIRYPYQRKSQIRMVAGFAEVIDSKENLVAGACNHPNCLVIPFKTVLKRHAA